MKDSSKDQMKGAFHETTGTLKEVAGKLSKDPNLEIEGANEKTGGKIQKVIAKIEKAVGA